MKSEASTPLRPAVFLDRDGTLNVEKHYLHRIEDWEWIPGAAAAVSLLNRRGFAVVVVTNQAGIARGLYGEAEMTRLHTWMRADLEAMGARVDGIYHCPHHPDYGQRVQCTCRKPAPGLLLRAASDLGLDLARSFIIGDRESDLEAGLRCGVTPLLVATGYGERTRRDFSTNAPFFPDVSAAVGHILDLPSLARRDVRGPGAA